MSDPWYIEYNLKHTPGFNPVAYSPSVFHDNFIANNAITYGSSSRYASRAIKNAWWMVTLPRKIRISMYRIKEPNYEAGTGNCHQKSWDLYGSENSENWTKIDEQRDRNEHNAASYLGSYKINNTSPFIAFKLCSIDSFSVTGLTFCEFDVKQLIIGKAIRQRKIDLKLVSILLIYIIFLS